MITKDRANEVFDYVNGELYWKHKTISRNRVSKKGGLKAGYTTHGYLRLQVDKVKYYNHQIIFLMHNGYIPDCIDHIDGNTLNNSIENLRVANKSSNACNSKMREDNTSGHRNVVWHKKSNKWAARVQINSKSKHLGVFDDFEFACFVADEARLKYHGDFVRL
jgi:hypothetical protein